MSALPDPVTQAAFYQGVPAKRAVAWLSDRQDWPGRGWQPVPEHGAQPTRKQYDGPSKSRHTS